MESRNEKRMLAAACPYAYSRFVLNFYMFYETLADQAAAPVMDELKVCQERFLTLTGRFSRGEPILEELDQLREQIIKEAELLTVFVDRFLAYEYVLNRMEGRFSDTAAWELVDDERMTDQIMKFILDPQDVAIAHDRLKMILEQLPIRFTRAKFFSIVSQSLSVYEGTDKKSLEQQLGQLRIVAMLEPLPDQGHERLLRLLTKLQGIDHKTLTREGYQELLRTFKAAQESLSDGSYTCMQLMDLVNDLYVVCLTRGDTVMDSQEETLFKTILEKVQEKAGRALAPEPDEAGKDLEAIEAEGEMLALLTQMEGKQEHYQELWSRYEMADAGKDTDRDDDQEGRDSLRVRKVTSLLSTSSFMSLTEELAPEGEKIRRSKGAVEEMCQSFIEELDASWKTMPKIVVRAVMARLLSALPLFFTSVEELKGFVLGSLTACSDQAEKAVCADLIRQIMESGDALV